jgi:hypothetical protein
MSADMSEGRAWDIEDVSAVFQAPGEIDVLVPELEILVPASDRLEVLSPHE